MPDDREETVEHRDIPEYQTTSPEQGDLEELAATQPPRPQPPTSEEQPVDSAPPNPNVPIQRNNDSFKASQSTTPEPTYAPSETEGSNDTE